MLRRELPGVLLKNDLVPSNKHSLSRGTRGLGLWAVKARLTDHRVVSDRGDKQSQRLGHVRIRGWCRCSASSVRGDFAQWGLC